MHGVNCLIMPLLHTFVRPDTSLVFPSFGDGRVPTLMILRAHAELDIFYAIYVFNASVKMISSSCIKI